MKAKVARLQYVVALGMLNACGGEAVEPSEIESIEEAITRGTLITSAANDPLGAADATLKWGTNDGVNHSFVCSGAKIGARRVLTARHCVGGLRVGTKFSVTNSTAGVLASGGSITAVHHYPSRLDVNAAGDYVDAALIDVDTNLPGPTIAVRGSLVTNQTGTFIGYGCDAANASHDGKKQTGNFFPARLQPGPNRHDAAYVHTIGSATDPQLCPGDSGGPLYFKNTAGTWEVGGMSSSFLDLDAAFTRTDALKAWTADPKLNDYADGVTGAFMNRIGNNCLTKSNPGSLRYCEGPGVVGSSQSWLLKTSGSGFNIISVANGTCLAQSSDGTQIVTQQDCSASLARWRFINPLSRDGFLYHHIQNLSSAKCVATPVAGAVSEGSTLVPRTCTIVAEDDQLFTLVKR